MSDDEMQYAKWLMEAQREVDAMLPDSPPIAPQPLTEAQLAFYEGQRNAVPDLAQLQRNMANNPEYVGRYVETSLTPRQIAGAWLNGNRVCIECGGLAANQEGAYWCVRCAAKRTLNAN